MPNSPRYNELVFKYLRNAGGSLDMNAATPAAFFWQVPAGRVAEIIRVNFSIVDGAAGYGEFAGLGAALTNGLKIEIQDAASNVLFDFLDGQTIKTNEQFGNLAGIDGVVQPSAGDDFIPIRWTIARAIPYSAGLVLDGGQKIVVTTQDALNNITFFRTMVQGRYY